MVGGMLAAALGVAVGSPAMAQAANGCGDGRMFADNGSICDFNINAAPRASETQGAVPAQIIDRPAVWRRQSAAPQVVGLNGGGFTAGSILIDQRNQFLYFVEAPGRAIKYVIGVGRAGEEMSTAERVVFKKDENPYWDDGRGNVNNPMFERGPAAVLGARGMFLQTPDGVNEGFLIHGTNRPDLLAKPDGQRHISGGCIRMFNGDVVDLYSRVRVGATVRVFARNELAQYLTAAPRAVTP